MRSLLDIPKEELRGKRVLVRAGLDVPILNGSIPGRFRIDSAIPTLRYLQENGARIVVIAHIGRDVHDTLAPVAEVIKESLPTTFVPDLLGEKAKEAALALQDGEMIMLEDLRHDIREVENDEGFAKELSEYGELYVNDAFSACHRVHASIVGIPKVLPSVLGLGLEKEIDHLKEALTPPPSALCIIAGAKFETKEPLLRKLLEAYDHVYVAGALANDIFRARGYEVGISRVSNFTPAHDVLTHPRLLVPTDATVLHEDNSVSIESPSDLLSSDRNMDLGPASFEQLKTLVSESALTLWNGPTGVYEEGFEDWSIKLAHLIADKSPRSIVGGGDTVTAIDRAHLFDKFSFVSTGGGAMLQFLLEGTLPGIDALS